MHADIGLTHPQYCTHNFYFVCNKKKVLTPFSSAHPFGRMVEIKIIKKIAETNDRVRDYCETIRVACQQTF